MSSGWRAAAATTVVTPQPGVPMAGYMAREGTATGHRDSLEANLLLLAAGSERVLLVTMDMLAITDRLRAELSAALGQALDLSPDKIVLAASHTHSAPLGWVGTIHPVLPGEFDATLIAALVEAIAAAASELTLQAANVTFAASKAAGLAANRHRPDGPADPRVGVLRVQDAAGADLAVLFDFACHPTVLGPTNVEWSSDWVGVCRSVLRLSMGPIPLLFLQGCSGDVSTRFTRLGDADRDLTRVGVGVAKAVETGLVAARPLSPTLRHGRTLLTEPTRRDLEHSPTAEVTAAGRLGESHCEGASAWQAVQSTPLPPTIDLRVSVLTLGHVRWLMLPVEPSASFGLRAMKGHQGVRVVGYCDGYDSYLPDAQAFVDGQYEAAASFFDAATAAEIEDKCLAFLAGNAAPPVTGRSPTDETAVDTAS